MDALKTAVNNSIEARKAYTASFEQVSLLIAEGSMPERGLVERAVFQSVTALLWDRFSLDLLESGDPFATAVKHERKLLAPVEPQSAFEVAFWGTRREAVLQFLAGIRPYIKHGKEQ